MPRLIALIALVSASSCHWVFSHDPAPAPPRDHGAELAIRDRSVEPRPVTDLRVADLRVADLRIADLPVAQPSDARILKTVSTLAKGLNQPHGVAVAGNGEVYVADFSSNKILRIAAPAPVVVASLQAPTSVAIAGTSLYCAEFDVGKIKRIELPGGIQTEVVGGLDHPGDFVLDSKGTGYIAEFTGGRILKLVSASKTPVDVIAGKTFNSPHMLALDEPAGKLYFTEWGSKVGVVDLKTSTVSWLFTTGTSMAGIALDPARRLLYVSERNLHQIRVIELSTGSSSVLTGSQGYQDGPLSSAKFESPEGLAVGVDGRLYVAEFYGGRVRVID